MKSLIDGLNKAFENRIRLGIMSVLMIHQEVDYTQMKEWLDVTDGNLSSHTSALEKLEYLEVLKVFVDKKPKTSYRITSLGKVEFKKHIKLLEKLIQK